MRYVHFKLLRAQRSMIPNGEIEIRLFFAGVIDDLKFNGQWGQRFVDRAGDATLIIAVMRSLAD